MKKTFTAFAAVLISSVCLAACHQSDGKKMSIQQQTEQRFKLNPNPQEAYRIRIKINDAPGVLKPINKLYVGYAARNCSYVINWIEGVTSNPQKSVPFEMTPKGNDEYETVFYADAVQNEDYFGDGICRWQPENFGASFKATGKVEETEFNISDIMQTLMEKKTLTKYYWKGGYPYYKNDDGSIFISSDGIGFATFGESSRDDFGRNRNNLFTITVTLEEVKK